MRLLPLSILSVVWALFSCAGSQAEPTAGEPAPPAKDAPSFAAHGLEVQRPTDWEFVAPDNSVVPDTVAILQGPLGAGDMRPAVEISRRQLSAADRKRKPAHILTALALELVQTFAAFDAEGEPVDIQVAGLPAALIRMKLTESLPDGAEVERVARFYAIVQGDQMWVIRCFGPADGSADAAFDTILGSVTIQS